METLKSLFGQASASEQSEQSGRSDKTQTLEYDPNAFYQQAFDSYIPKSVEMQDGDAPFEGNTEEGAWTLLPAVDRETCSVRQLQDLAHYQKDFLNLLNQKDSRAMESDAVEWVVKPDGHSGDYMAYLVDKENSQYLDSCLMSPQGLANKCQAIGCDFTNADAFILKTDITAIQSRMSLSDEVYDSVNGYLRSVNSEIMKSVEDGMSRESYESFVPESQKETNLQSRIQEAVNLASGLSGSGASEVSYGPNGL